MHLSCLGFALASSLLACSSSDTGDAACPGTADAGDDGKVHPPPDGQTMTEAEACDLLKAAYDERTQTMQMLCTGTVATCPNKVRSLTGKTDATYDRGSVQGCADYYEAQVGCNALNVAFSACVPATHPLPGPAATCP